MPVILFKRLIQLVMVFAIAGCVSTTDPSKQSTFERIVAGATGLDEKTLAEMSKALANLKSQTASIEESLDYYRSQLYLVKKNFNRLDLTEKELAQLKIEMTQLETQTKELEQLNNAARRTIQQKNSEIVQRKYDEATIASDIRQLKDKIYTNNQVLAQIKSNHEQSTLLRAKRSLLF